MQSTLNIIILAGTFITGLLYCFRGNRSLKVFIAIYAFVAGTAWMYGMLTAYAPAMALLWVWIIAAACGLVLALLAFFFFKFTLFLAGGLFGLALFRLVEGLNPAYFSTLPQGMLFLIGLIFFIVFGFLTLRAQNFLIILGTAIWGAYTTVLSGGILIGLFGSPQAVARVGSQDLLERLAAVSVFSGLPSYIPVLITVILAIWGIVYQMHHPGMHAARR